MIGIRAIFRAMLLASVCVTPAPLASQKKAMVVAILEPSGDGSRINQSTLRGTLEEFVNKSKGYSVVDRARADQVFGELNLQRTSKMIDPNTAKDIGKHLGADFVCVSELIKEEGYSNINISLINVETGVLSGSGSRLIQGEDPRRIADATKEIASTMLGVKR
jgi:hypothetical protein